jgi:hypothetical protein
MRIEQTGVSSPTPLPVTLESGSKVGSLKTAVRDAEAAQADASFTPTADLSKLLELVRQVPDVRTDLVQEVSARAAVGELTSREAATDTAAALLDATGG